MADHFYSPRRSTERWWENLSVMLGSLVTSGVISSNMTVGELRERAKNPCKECGTPIAFHGNEQYTDCKAHNQNEVPHG